MASEEASPAPALMTDEALVDAFWQAVADAETAEGSEGGKWAKAVNDGDRYRAMILAELARLRGEVTRLREVHANLSHCAHDVLVMLCQRIDGDPPMTREDFADEDNAVVGLRVALAAAAPGGQADGGRAG